MGTAVGGTASWLTGSTPALSLVGHWWAAETLGVLTILPLVSVWLAERHRISLRMRLFVILPVFLATILRVLAFQEIRVGKWRRIQAEFTRKAQVMATTVRQQLHRRRPGPP